MTTYTPQPYPIKIDGVGYLCDMTANEYQRRSVEINFDSSNADRQLTPTGVWRRSVESWHLGMGQSRMDRETSVPFRFRDSQGVDVWTKWQASLLNDVNKIIAWPTGVSNVGMTIDTNGYVWAWQGTYYRRYNNTGLYDGNPTYVEYNLGKTINEMVYVRGSGTYVGMHATTSDGYIYRIPTPGTHILATTMPNRNGVWLFGVFHYRYMAIGSGAAGTGALFDCNMATGVPTEVWQHPLYDQPWCWTQGPKGIYMAYNDGQIMHVGIQDSMTAWDAPFTATTLPDGEIAYSLLHYMGYVIIGTSLGLRFAVPDSQGYLTYGPLIPTPAAVFALEPQGQYVWYGLGSARGNNYVGPNGRAMQGLGRVDLANFTAPLTPAYASDLLVENPADMTNVNTSGPFAIFTTGRTASLGYAGRRVFFMQGQGIFAEAINSSGVATKVRTGWVDQGDVGFRLPDDKVALYTTIRTDPLPAKTAIDLDVKWDEGVWTAIGTHDLDGTLTPGNFDLSGQRFSKSAWRYTLRRDADAASAATPTLTRWELRVAPQTGRASEFTIPVMLYDTINVNGITQNRSPDVDYEALLTLVHSGAPFQYSEGSKTWTLYAQQFVWKPEKPSMSGKGFQGIFYLVAREIL